MTKQADQDEYDVEDLGALIEEGLNEALAWRRGEITLPVYNVPPDYGKRIRAMRKRLGVKSRAAFAEAFGVPEKTLQNWEQGRTTPDPTARAYLRVIEADPDAVRRALSRA
mgnify:CR=1 FL=1